MVINIVYLIYICTNWISFHICLYFIIFVVNKNIIIIILDVFKNIILPCTNCIITINWFPKFNKSIALLWFLWFHYITSVTIWIMIHPDVLAYKCIIMYNDAIKHFHNLWDPVTKWNIKTSIRYLIAIIMVVVWFDNNTESFLHQSGTCHNSNLNFSLTVSKCWARDSQGCAGCHSQLQQHVT